MSANAYTNALIFGAGQVGMNLMEQLAAEGVQVTLVNRSGRVKETLPTGVSVVAGDLNDPATVTRLAANAEVVFQTAQPAYTEWPKGWPPLIRSIVDGIAQTSARLVFVDNLYMYGSTHGQPIREDMPYAAAGHKGKVRAQVAATLLDAHEAGRIQVTIGRASDFFGPRGTDTAVLGERFFEAAFAGKSVDVFGNPNLPHTYTYLPDFARGLITLSRHSEAYGRAWHTPNHQTISTAELIRLIGAEMGQEIKTRAVSPLMVSMLGLFVPIVREMKEMMYEFQEPYIVDDSQFRAAFGAQTTPLRDAARSTVAWFRQHHVQGMKQVA
ncbi:MAG: NAD-dependent epimerase/dehydratase family protein [Caldilinea sp.]